MTRECASQVLTVLVLSNPESLSAVDLEEIRKIIELMDQHELTHFHLSRKDFHLKLKKGADLDALRGLLAAMPAPAAAQAQAPAPFAGQAPAAAPAAPTDEEITSPMVGTFYGRPAPDAPDFVNAGDAVSEGQTICIIEAMKVMNEIKAERSGVITAKVAQDSKAVQFGDVLFRIK
jgi:acetyl-CoA carboxylase biotin carboxyl carrier protein